MTSISTGEEFKKNNSTASLQGAPNVMYPPVKKSHLEETDIWGNYLGQLQQNGIGLSKLTKPNENAYFTPVSFGRTVHVLSLIHVHRGLARCDVWNIIYGHIEVI